MAAEGFVPAYVDEDLPLNVVIYRAVSSERVDWLDLDDLGAPALKSQAFQNMKPSEALDRGYEQPAMSVVLSHILEEHGEPPDRALDLFDETYGIAAFSVSDLRSIRPRLGVCANPLDGAPWHGLVFGLERRLIKKKEQYGMMDAAVLIKHPIP